MIGCFNPIIKNYQKWTNFAVTINFFLIFLEVCGEIQTQFHCPSCEQPNQCEECSKFLHAKKVRKDHKIFPIEEWLKQSKSDVKKECSIHPSFQLKLFCQTCTSLVCLDCITGDHKGHVCQQIHEGVDPMFKFLNEKKDELNSQKNSFETEVGQVKDATSLIITETKESKEKISASIEELIQMLKKKEKDLLEDIEHSEIPKVEQLEEQQKLVEKNLTLAKERLSIVDSTLDKKDVDSFIFVYEALQRKKEFESFVLDKTPGHPVCVPGSYKSILIKKQKSAINALDLLPPIDFNTSIVHSTKKSIMEQTSWEHIAPIHLKNHLGYPLTLSREYSLYVTVEGPKDVEHEVVKTNTEGSYELRLKGDTLGDYKVRVYYRDHDLKGSPFHLKVTLPIPNTVDVPIQVSNIHSYIPSSREFFSLQKTSLKCFYIETPNKTREIKLPSKPSHIIVNEEGEYFAIEGDKLIMYDKNLKELWRAQLKDKGCGLCLYYNYIVVLTPKGPLLKYTLTGDFQSNIILQHDLVDAKSIVFVDNLFIISDETNVKVFCIEGVLRQEIITSEKVEVILIDHNLYFATSNSKQFKRLILTPDWEKKSQPKTETLEIKDIKDLKEDPPKITSPREGIVREGGRSNSVVEPKDSKRFNFFGGLIGKKEVKQVKSVQDSETILKIKNQGSINHPKVSCFCTSPTGDVIITGSSTEIKIWDYQTGELIQTIQSGAKIIETSGINIYSYTDDKKIKIFKFKDGELIKEIKTEEDIECFALSLDSRKIYCGTTLGSFICYETMKDGFYNFGKHGEHILSIYATKDARFVLTSSTDTTVKVWGTDGKEIKQLKGHTGPVKSVVMSFDGSHIISGSYDKTIKFWQNESYKQTKTIKLKDKLTCMSVTPNSNFIITASDSIKIFKIESGNEKISFPVKDTKNIVVDLAGRYFICSEGDNVNIYQTTKFPEEQKKEEKKEEEKKETKEEKKEESKDVKKEEEKKEEKEQPKETKEDKKEDVKEEQEDLEKWLTE